jgi:hypothetical protein
MQITFTSRDGEEVTVTDPRRPTATGSASVAPTRRPSSWIAGSWIISTMKV